MISLDDVQAAARRIDGVAHRTPVLTSRALDDAVGATVFLKAENLQRIGAFKLQWPGAQHAQRCSHNRPIKRRVPRQEPRWAINPARDPKRIEVSLVIGRDNDTARERNVFQVPPPHSPKQSGQHGHHGSAEIKHRLRQRPRIRTPAIAGRRLFNFTVKAQLI